MKITILLLSVFILYSCSEGREDTFNSLQVDYVETIPYLMFKKQVDSVFEIITYGKVSSLVKGDTLSYYILNDNNKVKHRLRSFMCCYYEYDYDSLGLLNKKMELTDYTEHYTYGRNRKNDTIHETIDSNMGRKMNYINIIKDEVIISKSGKLKKSDDTENIEFSDETTYEYNEENKLTKKIRKILNDPSGEFGHNKTITSYVWNQNVLKHVDIKQFFTENEKEAYFTTHIVFDSAGFPIQKTILKKQDTVCKTSIIRK